MEELTPSQKARLHEVADGMLKIYRTLVRMRYLESEWIQEGPHNIDALLSLYHSLGLDASIICLYSILPYVDTAGAEGVDFFEGGDFADFRREDDIKEGRNPMYAEEEEEVMRPWMTPLSTIGNHRCAIIYDARKHCIGIYGQMDCGSHDHNLHEGFVPIQGTSEDEETGDPEKENDGDEKAGEENGGHNAEDEDEEEADGEQEDDEEQEEEEEDEGEEGECVWDEMDSRPAANVLRDMVLWYHDLIEVPGSGEQSGLQWDAELLKPLYRKHGWPHADFDGDAFLIDQARAAAAASAKYDAEEPIRRLRGRKGCEDEDSPLMRDMRQMRDRLAAAQTVDEEWLARWGLWLAELRHQGAPTALREAEEEADRLCHGGQCQNPEDLPLWELRKLREESWDMQRSLDRLRRESKEMEAAGGDGEVDRGLRIRLLYAEKRAVTYQKAYEASQADAERACPGRSFPLGLGVETTGLDLEATLGHHITAVVAWEQEVESIRAWMPQLPDGAHQARKQVEAELGRIEELLKYHKEACRQIPGRLEQLRCAECHHDTRQ